MVRRAATVLMSLFFVVLVTVPAHAGPGDDPVTCAAGETVNRRGQCVLKVPPADGGQGDPVETEEAADGSTRPQAPAAMVEPKCVYGGKEIPCVQKNTGRWWSSQHDCYVSEVESPPAKSDPVWQGNTDGAIYSCLVPDVGGMTEGGGGTIRNTYLWSATPPAGPGAPLPDPRVLAQEAIAKMNLRAPEIGIVPEPGEGSVGVIGMPTWMWVGDAGPHTVGPITRQASAEGHTVTANAKVTKLVWDMGDGTMVTCTGRGTEYQDHYGKQDSPDCGHRYTEQGEYTVTVNATWTVTWAGLGQTGEIPMTLERSASITMGEVQVIN
ncbi:MAG: PKD domain-containing protein [Nocardioidaceae bacterium]|nr:PKD domain-containing protein [Nocardioidaceae bacterium]